VDQFFFSSGIFVSRLEEKALFFGQTGDGKNGGAMG
jgi:hypothetical protein